MSGVLQGLVKDRCAVWLALMAVCVYLPGITWGLPHATNYERTHAWGNDDAAPLAALAEMHDTFVAPAPNRNVAYPWGHYFVMACAMAPYMAWLMVSGQFAHPMSTFPFGLIDPVGAFKILGLLCRAVSILLGVAAVIGVYLGARVLWGQRAGCIAAVFTMLLFPMAYYARLTNPDMPVLGWTSLALAIVAVSLRGGLTVKRGLWLGIFVALAGATKDQAAGSFMLVAPLLGWIQWRSGNADRLFGWYSKGTPIVAAVVSLFLAYCLMSGIFVDPARFAQHLEKLSSASMTRDLYLRHPLSWAGTVQQLQDLFGYLLDVMSPPLLFTACAGILLAMVRDKRSLGILLSSLGFLIVLTPVGMSRVHYLLPVALPLTYFAGYALDHLLKSPVWRLPAALACGLMTGWLFLQTVDLIHDMLSDSRYAAGEWLDQRLSSGDRVMHFGYASKLPHLRADVRNLHIVHEKEAISAIKESRPEFILVIPQDMNEWRQRLEWRNGLNSAISPFSKKMFDQLVDGTLGYRLVEKFHTPRLIPWLDRPFLSYASVNPPVQVFMREDRAGRLAAVEPWYEAPYGLALGRVREVTADHPGDAVL